MRFADAQKRFGQNFLVNEGVVQAFANTARSLIDQLTEPKVVEIGPGMGAITKALLQHCRALTAYEIDTQALTHLTERYAQEISETRLVLHHADVYELLKNKVFPNPDLVVSNLPYNIGSRILVELSFVSRPPLLVIGLQKEVGQRLLAQGDLNLLGGWLRLVWNFQKVMTISPGSYRPMPKVSSVLLSATVRENIPSQKDRKSIFGLLKHLLRFPNKTLLNNLKDLPGIQPHQWLEEHSLPLTTRLDWKNYESILLALLRTESNKLP